VYQTRKVIFNNLIENKKNYDLEDFRNYLRKRHKDEFILIYLNHLPLAYNFGETSWSDEDILEYQKTGFIPPFKNKLLKIYKSILEYLKKNSKLFEICKNWLNEENSTYFLSIYGYINSKAFQITLKELGDIRNSDHNKVNQAIDKSSGYILVPVFDMCLNNLSKNIIRDIKFKFSTDDSFISLHSSENYKNNTEITFNLQRDFSNDYSLLNYGYLIRNNPYQEYVFRFDIPDKDYKFYKTLKRSGVEMKNLSILEVEKLTILVNLRNNVISKEIIKIISTFLEFKKTNWKEVPKKNKEYEILMRYYSIMITNIKSIFDENSDNIDIWSEITSYVGKFLDNESKKKKLSNIVEENTKKFLKNTNDILLSPLDDDLQNLFYFKHLHNNIKKSLIYKFTFENLKIVFSQISIILNILKQNLVRDINSIKNKYI
jgi:hypothetical protein